MVVVMVVQCDGTMTSMVVQFVQCVGNASLMPNAMVVWFARRFVCMKVGRQLLSAVRDRH